MARKSGVGIPRWLVLIALLAGGVYLLRGRGDGMFFSPDSDAHGTPARYDLEVEKVRFAARDGPQLSGWWVPAPGGRGTIVYCHGDGANLTRHARYVTWMPQRGFNVLLFDYRGYGASVGTPTREGLVADTLAAIDVALGRDPDRTVVFGHGIGAAAAIHAAVERPAVKAVVVEAGFPSYRRAAVAVVPALGLVVPWLVSPGLDPADAVRRLPPRPILVVHGEHDDVFPVHLGRELFEAALPPKEFYLAERCGHESPCLQPGDGYMDVVVKFLDAALRRR